MKWTVYRSRQKKINKYEVRENRLRAHSALWTDDDDANDRFVCLQAHKLQWTVSMNFRISEQSFGENFGELSQLVTECSFFCSFSMVVVVVVVLFHLLFARHCNHWICLCEIDTKVIMKNHRCVSYFKPRSSYHALLFNTRFHSIVDVPPNRLFTNQIRHRRKVERHILTDLLWTQKPHTHTHSFYKSVKLKPKKARFTRSTVCAHRHNFRLTVTFSYTFRKFPFICAPISIEPKLFCITKENKFSKHTRNHCVFYWPQ